MDPKLKPLYINPVSEELAQLLERTRRAEFDGGGGGGYDEPMEERVKKLEADVSSIKVDVATIASNYATKADIGELRADMHKMNAEIKTWTLATMITIIGTMLAAIFGIATIFNNASKSAVQTPATATAPIVIYAQPVVAPASEGQPSTLPNSKR